MRFSLPKLRDWSMYATLGSPALRPSIIDNVLSVLPSFTKSSSQLYCWCNDIIDTNLEYNIRIHFSSFAHDTSMLTFFFIIILFHLSSISYSCSYLFHPNQFPSAELHDDLVHLSALA